MLAFYLRIITILLVKWFREAVKKQISGHSLLVEPAPSTRAYVFTYDSALNPIVFLL